MDDVADAIAGAMYSLFDWRGGGSDIVCSKCGYNRSGMVCHCSLTTFCLQVGKKVNNEGLML